ncbi:MAG: hypothetical protein GQ535_04610 [Rhodobacteraceae bacterium]|nr:hypothetical protein [Paracoccaceae bacterium]
MIKPLALAGILVAATPVGAQDSANAQLNDFVGVFRAHNCVLATRGENAIPEAELMGMFADVGIDEQMVAELASGLLDSGQATVELETDAVTVLPPLCIAEASE